MSDLRQAAMLALDALEHADKDGFWREQRDAITALHTALEQQQAEPVAWMDKHGNIDQGWDAILEPDGWMPLYTAQHQYPWVGLTDEQLDDIAVVAQRRNLHDLRIVIEAKLKEKNT